MKTIIKYELVINEALRSALDYDTPDEQVILLAKVLNMNVIAEGVETKEQLNELKDLKCDEVQGFYYACPVPEEEFIKYVQKRR